MDWIYLAPDGQMWQVLVKAKVNIGFIKCWKFLEYKMDY